MLIRNGLTTVRRVHRRTLWMDRCPNRVALIYREKRLSIAVPLGSVGYQGCARSGVAFTSERLLLEGAIPRIPALSKRLTSRRLPFSEPSATIVWKALYQVGIADVTLLWNAVQLHPFNVGDHLTNRTPKKHELMLGAPAMKLLSVAFPEAKIVAVGNNARDLIESMGIRTAGTVRHPARGGATEFTTGLAQLAGS